MGIKPPAIPAMSASPMSRPSGTCHINPDQLADGIIRPGGDHGQALDAKRDRKKRKKQEKATQPPDPGEGNGAISDPPESISPSGQGPENSMKKS